MMKQHKTRDAEKGNVLFLILIAVALFAALSYVVTQSTRSGGGSTEREKNILSSAQMTQYPTALRTAVIRMVLGGVSVENIKFDAPGSTGFSTLSSSQLVFHPQGGGAAYQEGPADLSASGNAPLAWSYNTNFAVQGIGIDTAGGQDVVGFLPGISQGVCRQVNEELGVNPVTADCTGSAEYLPAVDTAVMTPALINEQMDEDYDIPAPTDPVAILKGNGASCDVFLRKAAGCFSHATISGGSPGYVFFSVLLER